MNSALPILTSLLLTSAALSAAEPPGYYASITTQSGTALRAALHQVVNDHTPQTYSATRDALKLIDEDPNNAANVLLIYSRRSELKTNFAVSGTVAWNREHVWPNSLGIDDAVPAYSDLFNLRAADLDVNNRRANLLFDESNSAEGPVTADPEAPLCTKDMNSWEVPAVVKGDLARSMFYMDVRYEGDRAGEPDLILTDNLSEITTTANKFGRLTTLLLWHLSDPVDAAERLRQEAVFGQQGNRNPFVDRPQWVEKVFADPLYVQSEVAGNQLRLKWWEALTPSAPQQSTNLRQWISAGTNFQREGAYRTLLVPMTEGRLFFRLPYRKPDVP